MEVTLRNDPADVFAVFISLKGKLKSKLVCKYLNYCFEMPVLLTGTVHSRLIKLANGCTLQKPAWLVGQVAYLSCIEQLSRQDVPVSKLARLAWLCWHDLIQGFSVGFVFFFFQFPDQCRMHVMTPRVWCIAGRNMGCTVIMNQRMIHSQRLTNLLVSSRFLDNSYVDVNVLGVPFPQKMYHIKASFHPPTATHH